MTIFDDLFFIDERIEKRRRGYEIFKVIAYTFIHPTQWRYAKRWVLSLKSTPLKDRTPWMSYGAIDYIEKIINPSWEVLEYGSGGSTLYFSSRVKKVKTIEHHTGWFNILKKQIDTEGLKNINLCNIKPDLLKKGLDWTRTFYGSTRDPEYSFERYVKAGSEGGEKYDLLCVDGRSRVACIIEAYSVVKDGGYIVLDNSQRKDYYWAFMFLNNKARLINNFKGLTGYETFISQTTVWQKNSKTTN